MKTRLPGLGAPVAPLRPAFAGLAGMIPRRESEPLFAGGQMIHTVREGDAVPVYIQLEDDGSVAKVMSSVVCDFRRCASVFNNAAQMAQSLDINGHSMASKVMPGVNAQLMVRLWSIFVMGVQLQSPNVSLKTRIKSRERLYKNSPVVALSAVAGKGLGECVEQSVMGKHFMDQFMYPSMVLHHAFLYDAKGANGMMHAMVAIPQGDHVLLYDPSNAMAIKGSIAPWLNDMTTNGEFYVPTMYKVPRERWDRLVEQGRTGPAWIDLSTDSVWHCAVAPEKAWVGFAMPGAQTAEPAKWRIPPKGPDSLGSRPGQP